MKQKFIQRLTAGSDTEPILQKTPAATETKLKREIGLVDACSIIVGIIVGSGIFVSPKGVLLHSGSVGVALLVWLASGLLSLVGALCYAELGTMIPKSGGDYAYIYEAFGPLPSFLYIWVALLVIMPTGNAIIALTFANYILKPIFPECSPTDDAVRIIAGLVITLLTAVNCINVKWSTRVQDFFTVAKVLALVVIILTGFVYLALGHTGNIQQPMKDTTSSPGHIALAFYSGLFSYSGWNYVTFVTEELKNPTRDLPRAIYISLPLVTAIYVLANIAYFAVLTPTQILSSNAVAVTFGDKLLGVMRWLMPFFVACSTFGSVNGGIFASSRLLFVGAREGHMPKFMSLITVDRCTPAPCLIVMGLITLAMLTTSDVFILINFTSFIESVFITMSVAALLYLRWTQPKLERPIKVNILLPVFFFVVCTFLVCLPIYVTPFVVLVGSGIILSGLPVYYIFIHQQERAKCTSKAMMVLNILVQKLCMAMPEEA
jgi:amino acid transporter